ncbi:MAG: O-antigen ligase family protein [Opitutus sp.]|nr:O-antigen ligase family protein [Opitutus sp.]
MVETLRNSSGWLLLCALALAPLAWAGTRPAALTGLTALVAAGGAVWAVSALSIRPALPLLPLIGAGLVAAVALCWCFLPSPTLPEFTAKHFARVSHRWPTSMIPREPATLIMWASACVLAFLAWLDLLRESLWRFRTALTVAATGIAVAVLGLAQNATHARGIFWEHGPRVPTTFFGTFYHHTSAGAYLNCIWPVALGAALLLLQSPTPRARVAAGALLAGSMVVLAAHAGHISRFPQVVAAVFLGVSTFWIRPWRFMAGVEWRRPWVLIAVALLAVTAVSIVMQTGRTQIIRDRWASLEWRKLVGGGTAIAPAAPETWPRLMRGDLFVVSDHSEYPLGDRGAAYATAGRAIGERPWLGWGPGGWIAAAAACSVDPFIRTFFQMLQFTHQDYLQTAVEWGLWGALGWALLVPAGVMRAVRTLRARPERDWIAVGAVLALGAVLTQSLIDFPLQIPALQLTALALAALAWTSAAAPAPSLSHST